MSDITVDELKRRLLNAAAKYLDNELPACAETCIRMYVTLAGQTPTLASQMAGIRLLNMTQPKEST